MTRIQMLSPNYPDGKAFPDELTERTKFEAEVIRDYTSLTTNLAFTPCGGTLVLAWEDGLDAAD